jgi:hypothetical protein
LSDEERILFLQRFAAEMVMNAAQNELLKQKIKAEKIKLKYLGKEKEVSVEDFGTLGIFHERQRRDSGLDRRGDKVEKIKKGKGLMGGVIGGVKKEVKKSNGVPVISYGDVGKNRTLQNFSAGVNKSRGISSGAYQQIENFLRNPAVQLIECSGPGKNILLKVKNKINMTRLVLNERGIEEVITNYANQAGVPVMGGVLKAAVDDLVISAVVSEYVGSRFIISRKSPYSLIGNEG